jgi:hypothetical protein
MAGLEKLLRSEIVSFKEVIITIKLDVTYLYDEMEILYRNRNKKSTYSLSVMGYLFLEQIIFRS